MILNIVVFLFSYPISILIISLIPGYLLTRYQNQDNILPPLQRVVNFILNSLTFSIIIWAVLFLLALGLSGSVVKQLVDSFTTAGFILTLLALALAIAGNTQNNIEMRRFRRDIGEEIRTNIHLEMKTILNAINSSNQEIQHLIETNNVLIESNNQQIQDLQLQPIILTHHHQIEEIIERNNENLKAIIELTLCYFIEDIYGYFLHRYMHNNKTLFKYVHQQHHRTQAECFITAFDVHIVELIAFYFVGLLIGPILISKFWTISFLGYNMWLCAATFFLIWSHTGIDIKWMPDTKFHKLHHKHYTVNYGTAFSDLLFGTARWN